ncbi:hypothetical protein MMC13_004249 [Lambiella insularis]|nr:hypothetical protein [Lambiella insularis]
MSPPPPTPTPLLHGSCACSAVRYASTALPSSISNCHCGACRKRSGGPYITWADLPRAALTWIPSPSPSSTLTHPSSPDVPKPGDSPTSAASQPAPHAPAPPDSLTLVSSPLATRGHCARCGSPVSMAYHCLPETVSVAVGTVDAVEGGMGRLRVGSDIFVGKRAGWDGGKEGGEDGRERWEGFPEGLGLRVERWREERGRKGKGEGGEGERDGP